MDFVVCPHDAAHLKVVERRRGHPDGPLLTCPHCRLRFVMSGREVKEVPPPSP
ncbi:hypothetical protein ACI799_07245 [Blastococcus sp. SYSU DS0753]